ncbi:hypothetical protein DMB38_13030 [Streptomyces sp. WAC 06738]|nr:hypothetical protein DMB38_13030 [Streptomyces sp. WAC 06738]
MIQWIKQATGDNESAIARRIGVAPATVNAWVHRKRGTGRGPNREKLRGLASEYGIPEDRVFKAAGRRTPGPLSKDAEERILFLYRELTAEQQEAKVLEMEALVQHNRSGAQGV